MAQDCDDGSLILESHTGERKHVWQGGDEKLVKELNDAEMQVEKLRAQIEFLKVQRGGQVLPEVTESIQRTWEGDDDRR